MLRLCRQSRFSKPNNSALISVPRTFDNTPKVLKAAMPRLDASLASSKRASPHNQFALDANTALIGMHNGQALNGLTNGNDNRD